MTHVPARLAGLAAALLLLAAPAQAAYAFGSIVDKNDYDFHQAPSVRGTTPGASKFFLPCFVDGDGDGRVEPADSVYLAVRTGAASGCGEVREKDLRLSVVGPLAVGEVKAADADRSTRLVPIDTAAAPIHAVRLFNDDSLATVRKTDTVYLDLVNFAAVPGRVEAGDLRLTPFGALKAGTRVQPGDADHGLLLAEFNGGAPKSLHTANMVYEFGKAWYLNADVDALAGGAVEEGDVRLTATVPNPFADIPANVGNPGKVVDGLALSTDTALPGQLVLATVTVKNPTAKVGSALVETSVDGTVVDARGTPTLAKDEVARLVVPFQAPSKPGRHKVTAGDYTFFLDVEAPPAPPAATATETAAATSAPAPASASVQSAPGPAGLALLGALAAALLVLRRRME